MSQQLEIKKKDENLYIPETAKVTKVKRFTDLEMFFEVELANGRCLNHDPGQFVQVSQLGIGEAPISISSPPNNGKQV